MLVQRGKGGGLTGALGGMGGQSAFGTKAGDAFTRVTIIAAGIWIGVSILAVKAAQWQSADLLGDPDNVPAATATDGTGADSATPGDPTSGLGNFLPPEIEPAPDNTDGSATPRSDSVPNDGDGSPSN